MQYLDKVKQKYEGEWIAFLVLDETPEGKLKGKLIAHHKARRSLHEILRKKKIKGAYMTFAGPLIKPGYAVLF